MPAIPTFLIAVAAVLLCGWWYTRRYVKATYISHPPIGKFVTVEGTKIHFIEQGSGRGVIMIHGSDGTLYNFKRSIFDLVASESRAIAFDRPGHGYSDAPPGEPLTISLNARIIREATQKLGITKPIVVGYSYGGAVALRWAIDHPDEIGALVLISPAAFPQRHLLRVFAYVAGIPVLGTLMVHTLFLPIARPQVRLWARRAFRPDPLPTEIWESVKAFSLRPKQFAAFAEEMRLFNRDLSHVGIQSNRVKVPVAILAGDGDILLAVTKQAGRLARMIPQATIKVFPQTGHEVHYKYREEILAAIREVAAKAK
jgi:pimeloyl-ACP methyl ester carboxylesterase